MFVTKFTKKKGHGQICQKKNMQDCSFTTPVGLHRKNILNCSLSLQDIAQRLSSEHLLIHLWRAGLWDLVVHALVHDYGIQLLTHRTLVQSRSWVPEIAWVLGPVLNFTAFGLKSRWTYMHDFQQCNIHTRSTLWMTISASQVEEFFPVITCQMLMVSSLGVLFSHLSMILGVQII